jgi:hypothetical protein
MANSKETYTSIKSSTVTKSSVKGIEFLDTKNNFAVVIRTISKVLRLEQDTANAGNKSSNENHVEKTTFSLANNINFKSRSFVQDEKLAHEVLEIAGPADKYQRKECVHDISVSQVEEHTNSSSASINQDPDPIRILNQNDQNIVYKEQVIFRYLQPPTPPPQAPIIICEKTVTINFITSTHSNTVRKFIKLKLFIWFLYIYSKSQIDPATATPRTLIVRERAPNQPPVLEPLIIEVCNCKLV